VHTLEYRIFLVSLRALREHAGLSQRELGRRLGQAHGYVAKCESGERQLNVIELRAWCEALDVLWTEFVQGLEQELKRELDASTDTDP
jgi:transcriptional regulator with XRE-family HTH domain